LRWEAKPLLEILHPVLFIFACKTPQWGVVGIVVVICGVCVGGGGGGGSSGGGGGGNGI
jgi:hypothetical protein